MSIVNGVFTGSHDAALQLALLPHVHYTDQVFELLHDFWHHGDCIQHLNPWIANYSRCPTEAKQKLYETVVEPLILPRLKECDIENAVFLHTPALVTCLFDRLLDPSSAVRTCFSKLLLRFGAGQSGIVAKTLSAILTEQLNRPTLSPFNAGNLKKVVVEASQWLFVTGAAEIHQSSNTILLVRTAGYLYGGGAHKESPGALSIQFANSLARRSNLSSTLNQNQNLVEEFIEFCEHVAASNNGGVAAQIIHNADLLNEMVVFDADGKLKHPSLVSKLANAIVSDEIALRADATFWVTLFDIPHDCIAFDANAAKLAGWLRLAHALDRQNGSLKPAIASQWSSLVSRNILDKTPLLTSLLSDADVQVVLRSVARSADRESMQKQIFSEKEIQYAAALYPLNQIMSSIRTCECSLELEVAQLLSPLLSDYRTTQKGDTEVSQSRFLEDVKHDIQRLVTHNWETPVYGEDLALLFRGANKIEWEAMAGEVIRFSDASDTIFVDPGYIKMLAKTQTYSGTERSALAMMYFVHEAVHHSQRVNLKSSVELLRRASAEHALMMLDLAADHIAAQALTMFSPKKYTLHQLKGLQSESLADFPVFPMHTTPARLRKSLRLASIRLDYQWLRAAERVDELSTVSHHYIECEPVSNRVVAMYLGPPLRVRFALAISNGDANFLVDCANYQNNPSETLTRLDAFLRESLSIN